MSSTIRRSEVYDAQEQDRCVTEDGKGDVKIAQPEVRDPQHEEGDLACFAQLRHTENDSGHDISAWINSIKLRQKKMKHLEDENPYREFMKPYRVVSSPKKHGLAVVINIANVNGFPFRAGSKEDEKNLCKLFETLRYNVQVEVDLSANDIRRLFIQLRDANYRDHNSL